MTTIPDITALTKRGEELRDSVLLILSEVSEELVKEAITERKRYRMELRRAKADIATAINELQKLKRDVDCMEGDQACDLSELEDVKWALIRGAKDSESFHATDPSS